MTPRQLIFVKEYLQDNNATRAYVRAGYSARTANKNAIRLMSHPDVRKLIDAAMADRAMAIRVTAVTQIEGLTQAARAELLSARNELKAIGRRLRMAADMARNAEALAVPLPVMPALVARPSAQEPAPYRPILPRSVRPDWEAPTSSGEGVEFAGQQSSFVSAPYAADPLGFLANR